MIKLKASKVNIFTLSIHSHFVCITLSIEMFLCESLALVLQSTFIVLKLLSICWRQLRRENEAFHYLRRATTTTTTKSCSFPAMHKLFANSLQPRRVNDKNKILSQLLSVNASILYCTYDCAYSVHRIQPIHLCSVVFHLIAAVRAQAIQHWVLFSYRPSENDIVSFIVSSVHWALRPITKQPDHVYYLLLLIFNEMFSEQFVVYFKLNVTIVIISDFLISEWKIAEWT